MMSGRKMWAVVAGALALICMIIIGGGFNVVIGECDRTVSHSSVVCGQHEVHGYFLFPKEIVGRTALYLPAQNTITIISREQRPIGCYRPFKITWWGIGVQNIKFVIEVNGKRVGQTVLDTNACSFSPS